MRSASGNSGDTNNLFGKFQALELKVSLHPSSEFKTMFVDCLHFVQLLKTHNICVVIRHKTGLMKFIHTHVWRMTEETAFQSIQIEVRNKRIVP